MENREYSAIISHYIVITNLFISVSRFLYMFKKFGSKGAEQTFYIAMVAIIAIVLLLLALWLLKWGGLEVIKSILSYVEPYKGASAPVPQ